MALPTTEVQVTDGNLGLVPSSPGQVQLKIGPAAGGTKNLVTPLPSKTDLVSTFTSGAMVDCSSISLDIPGRGALYGLRADTSIAGSNGSVTKALAPLAAGVPANLPGSRVLAGADANGDILLTEKNTNVTATIAVSVGGALAITVVNNAVALVVTNATTATDAAAFINANAPAFALFSARALGTGASVCVQTLAAASCLNGGMAITPLKTGVSIEVVVPDQAGQAKAVTLTGLQIVVSLATDAAKKPTTTAATIKTDLDALAAANPGTFSVALTGDGSLPMGAKAQLALTFGSTGTVSVSGAPLDSFQVRGKFTRSGTLNTGAFQIALDGGDTYTIEMAIPQAGAYAIPGTGLTLTFTPGAGPVYYQAGDTFSFDTVGPAMNLADLAAAFDVVALSKVPIGIIHVIGAITPTVFAALATHAAALENAKKYVLIIAEAAAPASNQTDAQWGAALLTDYANSANIRLGVCSNETECIIPVGVPMAGRVMRRNSAWLLSARAAAIPIEEDVGRVLSGPLLGCVDIYQRTQIDTLDTGRFSCVYEIVDYEGFYGQGRLMSPSGSDFVYWQDARVVNEAQRLTYKALVRFQSEAVRVRTEAQNDKPAGSIDPGDRQAIDDYLNVILKTYMTDQGHCTAVTAQVIDTDNLLQLKKLRVKVDVVPLGYLKALSAKVGLKNPALQLVR